MGALKIMRVVIDTNVIVSALLFGGTPGKLVPLWKEKAIHPLISREILEEYIRVLAYPKFRLAENEIDFLIYSEILPWFRTVVVKSTGKFIREDPSDDKFIVCAREGMADVIVSGDRHLLNLGSTESVEMVTPSQLLLRLKQRPGN